LQENNLIYTYKNTEVYAYWDTLNFYLKIKVPEIENFLFATGTGDTGEYYFPDLIEKKKFPLKLNHFLKMNFLHNIKSTTTENISLKIDTLENSYLINLSIPEEIYGNSEYIYFWLGFKIEEKGIFYTIPEEKENSFPVFVIPVDQDRDGKWDKGLNLKALIRITHLQEKEEELNLKKIKKFFNPSVENFEVEIESTFEPSNLKAVVYSLTGKKIKELETEKKGEKTVITWDGKDEAGKIQKPGVYLIVVKTGSEVWAQIPVVIFK